jgi:hypothetical protein
MIRNVRPASLEASHWLRWVPVPVGPLAKKLPRTGSIPIEGSPKVLIGSTIVGLENPIDVAAERAL